MNQHLQSILELIQQSESLSASEKNTISNTIKEVDKILSITESNLEKTEKVNRTTAILLEETIVELEQKRKAVEAQNRELAIESSLERVRTVAMSMSKPGDMLHVCHIISDQLQLLHVADIRNVQTAIIDESKGTYNNYQYFTQYQQGTIEEVEYNKHPKVHELVQQMQRSPDAFFSGEFKGKELDVWRQYRKDENQFPDPMLDEATAVYYYFYSIGQGGLGVSTYTPLIEDDIIIFKRFRNVFDLAYRRFLDIQQAEAQAREAQIEVAIERVRAKALAMYKSEDLHSVVVALKKELMGLRIPNITAATIYLAQNDGSIRILDLSDTGGEDDDKPQLQLDKIFRLEETDPDLWIRRMWDHSENYFVLEADEADFARIVQWIRTDDPAGAEMAEKIIREKSIKKAWLPTVKLEKGILNIDLLEPPTDEIKPILLKMGAGFDLAYKRFLDLQKAEAQAREAQIEVSLERVRAKAMAMHKSEDLNMAVATVFEELDKLDLGMARCGISILDKEKRTADVFTTSISDQGKIVNVSGDESIDIHPLLQGAFDAWVKQTDFSFVLEGKDLARYYQAIGETNIRLPDSQIILSQAEEIKQYFYNATFQAGCLFAFRDASFSEEAKKVMNRFADVFNLTYTRFLDLQKAEAQAREAQIEAALERVRVVAMGMIKDDDLRMVCETLYKELKQLGFKNIRNAQGGIIDAENKTFKEYSYSDYGSSTSGMITKYTDDPLSFELVTEIQQSKDAFFKKQISGDEFESWRRWRLESGRPNDSLLEQASSIWFYIYSIGTGGIGVSTLDAITEQQQLLLKRFKNVFELTYTRFHDLQKAETQAREAQIEAALERVRASAMAMHKSEDLHGAVKIMFEEFQKLNLNVLRCGVGILNKDSRTGTVWATSVSDNGLTVQISANESFDTHPLMKLIYQSWQKQEDLAYVLQGQDLTNYYKAMDASELKLPKSQLLFSEDQLKPQYYNAAMFNAGGLYSFADKPLAPEDIKIMKRFASVVNLTYNRFLDLQKAEAQAREATIEAALERVRGKAMAMHSSQDLSETINAFFKELKLLGIVPIRCGLNEVDEESQTSIVWVTTALNQGDSHEIIGKLTLAGHPVLEKIFEGWKLQQEYYPVLSGVHLREYYKFMKPQVALPDYADNVTQYGSYFYFKEGLVYAWTEKELSEEEKQIFRRFTAVISLTYRRYMELQKSEANAKDALRQSSLDRVRAEIASMRTTVDLERITPLIWNELTILDIPFIRCGVFIMDEELQLIHTFLSTPEGKAIAAFHLPYSSPGHIGEVLVHWKKNENYIDHWDEAEFIEFADVLVKEGALDSPEKYLSTMPKGGFYLHFLPFLQGMLYVGNSTQLSDNEIKLVQSVADAFSTAYARYEDFNKLESAKQQVDKTLTDLKQAQQQLVQSEKMASLGELTAGIAHEIQNPLNFVNNFSEVNAELIDELNAELAIGNMQQAKEIGENIKENEEKIIFHGKRADAIVKGMLQHSRSSSGVKEPTDINALTDEYLRLAYHGLRAKDKSFNATLKTDFDQSLGLVNIVAQDIGRVILNLITNAFYAVSEKNKQQPENYQPKVEVVTKRIGDKIEICVIDNGNGVPQAVLDKIFQPFFTTKPAGQGTGLGLSLSYDIVKAHGGELKVETTEGENAEFIIQLPGN